MKKRKQGMWATWRVSKRKRPAAMREEPVGSVARRAERTARADARERSPEARQRRPPKGTSRQPPPSDEMRTVTEIGSLSWTLGQTR